MGKKVKVLLLMFFLFQLHELVSSSALSQTLPADLIQVTPQSNGGNEGREDNATSVFKESQHFFAHVTSKVGGSTGSGENGNSGGSRSPNNRGGSNLIPVYAAGAANNRHQSHRGDGNFNRPSRIGLSSLVAASIASLVYLL